MIFNLIFLTVICHIEGMPLPKQVLWSRGGQPLDPSNDRFTLYAEEYANVYISKLIISNIHGDDFTTYNCSVTNGYGKAEKLIIVEKTCKSLSRFLSYIFKRPCKQED